MTSFQMANAMICALTCAVVTWVTPGTLPAGERPPAAPDSPVLVRRVGMEGVYLLQYNGPALRAKPAAHKSPLLLRISDVRHEGEATLYELRFIGARPGRYDLRNALERLDGKPLEGLSELPITVAGLLPEKDDGALVEPSPASPPRPWPYRVWMRRLAALWLASLAGWAIWRAGRSRRSRAAIAPADVPSPDPLHALVAAALDGPLSAGERARLELLLVAAWRREQSLTACTAAEAWRRLRALPGIGPKFNELEAWLHSPYGEQMCDPARLLADWHSPAPDAATATEAHP